MTELELYKLGKTHGSAVFISVLQALDRIADQSDPMLLQTMIETFAIGFFAWGAFDMKIVAEPAFKRGFIFGLTMAYGAHCK